MRIASRLLSAYRSAQSYPIFFVWESGLLEVLSHNLGDIAQEKVFQRLLSRVVQFAVAKLTQSAGARDTGLLELPYESQVDQELAKLTAGQEPYASLAPTALPSDATLQSREEQQIRDELEMDQALVQEAYRIAEGFKTVQQVEADRQTTRGVRVQGSTQTLMDPSVIDEIRREELATLQARGLLTTGFIIKGAISILKRTIVRFARQRSHGLYATVVEEILREFYLANVGEVVWNLMKKAQFEMGNLGCRLGAFQLLFPEDCLSPARQSGLDSPLGGP